MDPLTRLLVGSLIVLTWTVIIVVAIGSFLRYTGAFAP